MSDSTFTDVTPGDLPMRPARTALSENIRARHGIDYLNCTSASQWQ
jgi:hypothetical protein